MTTQTVTIHQQVIQLPVQQSVRSFLESMLTNPLLQAGVRPLIGGFEEGMEVEILTLFIKQVLHPAMINSRNNGLILVEDQAKAHLQKLLPPNTKIDEFLDELDDQNTHDYEKVKQTEVIDGLFQEALKFLCEEGNKQSNKIETLHNFLVERLVKLIDKKRVESDAAIDQGNAQADQINNLKAALERLAIDHQQLGRDYKQGRADYTDLLQRSYDIIRNYKR